MIPPETQAELDDVMTTECHVCGVGDILPSGHCDHCNAWHIQSEAEKELIEWKQTAAAIAQAVGYTEEVARRLFGPGWEAERPERGVKLLMQERERELAAWKHAAEQFRDSFVPNDESHPAVIAYNEAKELSQ